MGRSAIYVALHLSETCQTYVLRVQVWVWNFQLLPVLLLCPCIWGSQLNRLRIRAPFPEGLPQFLQKFKQYQVWSRLSSGSKMYIEAFMGLTLLYELSWRDVFLGTDAESWLESLSFGGSYYFWRLMAWTWDKGTEGTWNSPPPYWERSSSHNKAILPGSWKTQVSACWDFKLC